MTRDELMAKIVEVWASADGGAKQGFEAVTDLILPLVIAVENSLCSDPSCHKCPKFRAALEKLKGGK